MAIQSGIDIEPHILFVIRMGGGIASGHVLSVPMAGNLPIALWAHYGVDIDRRVRRHVILNALRLGEAVGVSAYGVGWVTVQIAGKLKGG